MHPLRDVGSDNEQLLPHGGLRAHNLQQLCCSLEPKMLRPHCPLQTQQVFKALAIEIVSKYNGPTNALLYNKTLI
jgi:hypothetical protein